MKYPTGATSLEDVLRVCPLGMFDWKIVQLDGGGRLAQAVLARDPSGAVTVLAMLSKGAAPKHVHPGGEVVIGIAGVLHDKNSEGERFDLVPGDEFIHPPGSIHAPSAEFWVGLFHQAEGSKLI